ncbi:unnamed protein product [Dracunculus medinensis]|uniref:Vacuolar protein sorting-associated protein 18 homolog n=1 Tax=Dracunculus medinensis TaxID=318479 RepID=A0A0N4UAR2_DRAME|nr:unnamed protein product [Dracunculus medinensis]
MNSNRQSNDDGLFVSKIIDFRPKGQISHLCSSGAEILLVCNSQQLLHISLHNLSENIDIPIPLSTHDRIAHVHLSTSGRHAIVTSTGSESFYVNLSSNQWKPLKRLKGHVISAVGWNLEAPDEYDTGFIVAGTTKGAVIELLIQSNGNLVYAKEITQNLTNEKDLPITNIELHNCEEDGDKQKWAILICSPGRLYCLADHIKIKSDQMPLVQPVVGSIWSSAFVEHSTAILQPLFTSKGALRYHFMDDSQRTLPSTFITYPVSTSQPPSKFCWVGASGYTLGSLDFTQSDSYNMLIEDVHIKHKLVNGRYDFPLDVALTEYHALFLYSNRLEAISILNQQCTFEDFMTNSGQLKGMCQNQTANIIWVFTESSIWKYKPNEESRNVWRIYLDRGEYGKARAITSKLKNRSPYQLVIKKEAEKFIMEKNYTAAAEVLAESNEPFEVIVLKFLSITDDRRNGLKRFLDLKLNSMNTREGKARRDATVLWLLEVQLSELAELKRMEKPPSLNSKAETIGNLSSSEVHLRNVRQQLELFLARPIVLDAVESHLEAVYRLMISHADFDSQLFLAQKLKDYDKVIDVHLMHMDYEKALAVLTSQHSPPFYYKYSPSLIEHVPFELIVAWINERKNLVPDLLLPALYRCQTNPKMVAAAFKYINFAIDSNMATTSLHNFMISLFAKHKPNALLPYFEKFGLDKNNVPYNVEFALRVCLEKPELRNCCVHLYCVDELYEEAVSLALTFDLDLAKKCAKRMVNDMSSENEVDVFFLNSSKGKYTMEMRRKVWLEIAKYVVEKQQDVVECMNLLKESNNIIKIQDVLPFFPEFATIELFKEPLCACLKEHSGKIKELQREMKEATDIAQKIRSDMKKLKTKFTVIRANDQCHLCGEVALSRPLFVFACRHFFHRDCLEKEVKSSWTNAQILEFSQLLEREKILVRLVENLEKNTNEVKKKKDELNELSAVRSMITDAIAEQCILCGPVMIELVEFYCF